MYNVKSKIATEFIDDKEILESLEYAKANKSNRELINEILEKAKDCKGLSHREAAVLLECELKMKMKKCINLHKKLSKDFMEIE